MAARREDDVDQLCGAMCAVSVGEEEDRSTEEFCPKWVEDSKWVKTGTYYVSPTAREKMNEIVNDCESIFSWDIKQLTGVSQNLMSDLISKMEEKCQMLLDEGDVFNTDRFYIRLIICYELYKKQKYRKSLCEIENIINTIKTCTFEESSKRYFEAFYHIAQASYAYVSLRFENLAYSEKIIKAIKPIQSLNEAENAAINAIKAIIFMEYPPIGNDFGLKFADLARNFDASEPEWIIIWLKAKGRVRRYHDKYTIPDELEMDGAANLCAIKTIARPLIQAFKLYQETAFIHKLNHNLEESNKFYMISSDLLYKAIELAKDNVKQLKSCFMTCLNYPIEFQSKKILDEVIKVLTKKKNNSHIDSVVGKYYLIHKDYERAKIHLSRGMAAGHFSSAMQLIKVECLLQPVHEYPLIKSLNLIYEVFPSPKRRLIVLVQILLYFYNYEDNPKELMKYVKLYLEQDIENAVKLNHLINAFPLFKTNRYFKQQQFLTSLFSEVKYLKSHYKWNPEEKLIIIDTLNQFNDMMNAKTYENQVQINNSNKIDVQKQSYNNDSNKRYYSKNSSMNSSTVKNELSWRKKQVDSNQNDCRQLPSTSKSVMPS